jgi:hypothetical protein
MDNQNEILTKENTSPSTPSNNILAELDNRYKDQDENFLLIAY